MSYIRDYHYYHGAVLAIIAEHDAFTSINKVPNVSAQGAYLLNHDTALYIKHSKLEGNEWRFTFTPEHQQIVRRLFDKYGDRTFIVLVCDDLICLLTYGEYRACLDENFIENEWLHVWRPEGGGFRIRGKRGESRNVIPITSFPNRLFKANS